MRAIGLSDERLWGRHRPRSRHGLGASLVSMPAVSSLAAVALLLAGCSALGSAPSQDPPSNAASGLHGSLTIFAAASLAASFTELAEEFGADNPGVTIAPFSFDGSSTLATQIGEGAPADVFATADEESMSRVAAELRETPRVFTTNTLQLAVRPGNPLGIRGLADLADRSVQVVLCAPAVPCGSAAHTLLELSGVHVTPVSEEQNVAAVLTKVRVGEADAGLVYRTDVIAAAGAVRGIDIAGSDRATNSYPIAVMKGSKNPDAARAFVEFVLSPRGQAILERYGFTAP